MIHCAEIKINWDLYRKPMERQRRLISRIPPWANMDSNEFHQGIIKAAPLGAAVIATLNHITGLILPEMNFRGMG